MVIDHIDEDPENNKETESPADETAVDKDLLKEITEKALKRFHDVIQGNGVKTQSLVLEESDIDLIEFEAKNNFKIESMVSDKRTTGRDQGLVCGSMADVKLRISNEIDNLGNNKDIKRTTVEHLKTRKDVGFGVDHQIIKLDKFRQRYVIHESCNICRGDGKIECKHCRGKGREICNRCHGDKFMQCTLCRGAGMTSNNQNHQQQCTQCRGEGRIPCRYCHQSGQQQCKVCKASGQLACHECNHTGWRSHITIAQFKAMSRFTYEKEKLPPEVLPIIDDLGPDLIIEGHVKAEIIDDITRNEAMDKQTDPNQYVVGYDALLPWGNITATLKDMAIKAKIFGYNGETLFVTPFMEKVTAKPFALISGAALNPSLTHDNLQQAGKYRVVREIIYAASRYSFAKGAQFLLTKYPFGFQDGILEDALIKTDRILKNITQGPRKKGFIFGAVAAAVVFAAFVFSGLSNTLSAMVPIASKGLIIDIPMIALGILISIYTTKITARNALRDVIGKLLPEKAQKSLMPKIGVLGLYAALLDIALFICLQEVANQAGFTPSAWYEALRGTVPAS